VSKPIPPSSFTDEGGKDHKLTLKQKIFGEFYIKYRGNGVQAARAAGYAGDENVLGVAANENLRKPKVLDYIKFLLKKEGLTDESVDKDLLIVIRQDADLGAKMRGISEYNRIRGRYSPDKVKGEVLVIEKGWRVEKGDRDRD